VPARIRAQITVTATSLSDPAIHGQVVDTIGSLGQPGPNRYVQYFAVLARGQAIPASHVRASVLR
jgi:hypothetical protein